MPAFCARRHQAKHGTGKRCSIVWGCVAMSGQWRSVDRRPQQRTETRAHRIRDDSQRPQNAGDQLIPLRSHGGLKRALPQHLVVPQARFWLFGGGRLWAIKQRILGSHMPPWHRHMVTATTHSTLFCLAAPQLWFALGSLACRLWCIVLVCSGRRLLADRPSLPFPWTLSLHRRWCPSASHHSFPFLSLVGCANGARGGVHPIFLWLLHSSVFRV